MFMNLLAAGGGGEIENPLNFDWAYISGNLPKAFIATGIGVAMVFLILAVLIGFILLLRCIVNRTSNKPAIQPVAPIAQPIETDTVAEDGKTVAAITAAVSTILQEENNGETVEFVIRKIKRTR